MGLIERANALNRCSARAAAAAAILLKVKGLRANPPEVKAYFGEDPAPQDAFNPFPAQIDAYLADAEQLIVQAQTALNDGKP